MRPHRAAHRQKVRTRLDQRRGIIRRDPPDRHTRQLEQGRPPAKDRRLRPVMRFLGRGGIEGAERDIVRPRLARFHRKVTAVMAGHADLHFWPQYLARLSRVAVPLPQMHAIRAQPLGQRDAVVDDKGDLPLRAQLLQRLGREGDRVLIQALQPQLKRRHLAAVQSLGQLCHETLLDRGR